MGVDHCTTVKTVFYINVSSRSGNNPLELPIMQVGLVNGKRVQALQQEACPFDNSVIANEI
jgi:hypothetical protein